MAFYEPYFFKLDMMFLISEPLILENLLRKEKNILKILLKTIVVESRIFLIIEKKE